MSTQAKSLKPPKIGDEKVAEAILHDLFKAAGIEHYDTVKRYIITGRLLELRLRGSQGGVAIMPTSGLNGTRFKLVKFFLHDWLRMSGMISKDYSTPLEALRSGD